MDPGEPVEYNGGGAEKVPERSNDWPFAVVLIFAVLCITVIVLYGIYAVTH